MYNLREYGINYLINSGFVDALVKKYMFPSDINDLYEDYKQECYLAICELKDEVWQKLYNTAIEKGTEYEYQCRNYISMLIRNTVHSNSSNAYKKLKKSSLTERTKNDVQWDVYKNTIEEPKDIMEQIKDFDE